MFRIRLLLAMIAPLVAAPAMAGDAKLPVERTTNDRQTLDTLTAIHDRGARLFNAGDPAACYRLFQGALLTVRAVLPKELHDVVDGGLAEAERDTSPARRAMLLHDVIEAVRKSIHKTAGPAPTPIKLGQPRKLSSDGEPMKAPDLAAKPAEAEPSKAPPKIEAPAKPLEIEIAPATPAPKSNPVKSTSNPPPVVSPMKDEPPAPPPIIIPAPDNKK